jgi:hypothetical protein
MRLRHKNKTLTTLMAVLLGAAGAHRFYLHGRRDIAGWAYVLASVLYVAILSADLQQHPLDASLAALFPLPVFAGFVEALAIGVTIDEEWDAHHNIGSGQRTRSRWPLVVVLVMTLGGGFVAFIACLARATDLLYTGGSFG